MEVDDVEATARRIICHARDSRFKEGEYPEVPIYFRNTEDCKKVVDCINDRYYGGQSYLITVGVYH